jgi:hypothetical protein
MAVAPKESPMIALVALLVLVTMGGCADGERRERGAWQTTGTQAAAATHEACHAMDPQQPALEHACMTRGTVGAQSS